VKPWLLGMQAKKLHETHGQFVILRVTDSLELGETT